MSNRKYRDGQSGGSAEANQKERNHIRKTLFSTTIWYKPQHNATDGDMSLTHILLNHGDPAILFLSDGVVNDAIPYESKFYPILIEDIIERSAKFNGDMRQFLTEWVNQEVLPIKKKEAALKYLRRIRNRLK